jgi:outer membrane immunogenic protein
MKTLALSIAFAFAAAGTAAAADIQRNAYIGPAPYSAFSWSGTSIGLNVGYQWSSMLNAGASPNGFMGGAQLGHTWQYQQFVYGFETDIQASGAEASANGFKFQNPWFGTVRGRAGYAMNNILFYGTAGLAYGGGKVISGIASESRAHVGWTAGAGLQVGLTPNWSAKVEYLFVDLSRQHYGLTALDHKFSTSLLRFGFDYRF